MKKGEVKTGDLVVMNDTPTATVYRAGLIEGFAVELITTQESRARSIGMMDVSLLQRPTSEQLGN